jgi:hypothetical protein
MLLREVGSRAMFLYCLSIATGNYDRTTRLTILEEQQPHFYIIVPDEATAEILWADWLALWTPEFAGRWSQNCRKVEDREKDLIEVMKYEAKIFTEPDVKKGQGNKGTAKIYMRALDNIVCSQKRLADH